MNTLFRPVQSQKVSSGADPKSVLCIFYKQGQCTKGDKCKFSHDLSLEGKTEKKSLYVDSRDLEEGSYDYMTQHVLRKASFNTFASARISLDPFLCVFLVRDNAAYVVLCCRKMSHR